MGLRTDPVIALDNLATVPEDRLMRRLGTCPIMPEMDAILHNQLPGDATGPLTYEPRIDLWPPPRDRFLPASPAGQPPQRVRRLLTPAIGAGTRVSERFGSGRRTGIGCEEGPNGVHEVIRLFLDSHVA